ncbi:MAG: YbaB/EbfC family nucleoid-associated protein [candidate division WOR-3 bacterium]
MLKNIFDFVNLQKKAEELKEELKKERVTAESGGGMVKVQVNGFGDVIDLEIEEKLITIKDKELLEDLVVSAINKGREKAKEIFQEKLQEVIGLPPLEGIKDLIS